MKSVFLFTAPDGRNRAIGAFDSIENARRWGAAHGFLVSAEWRLDHTPLVFADTEESLRLQNSINRADNERLYAEMDAEDKAAADAAEVWHNLVKRLKK